VLLTQAVLFCSAPPAPAADARATATASAWSGRPLIDVLEELRSGGLPLLYSSQIVTRDLRVRREPPPGPPLERLQQALKPLGLGLRTLTANAGFAVVRAGGATASPTVTAEAQAGPAGPAEAAPEPLQEVHVYASRYSLEHRGGSDQAVDLSQADIERTVGASQDAVRVLRYFPGTAMSDVSAMPHVRGGAEDETLVLFDGVELYDPVHLKDFQGLFGLLDPQFMRSLTFYGGGFPVRYGNHTSGVMDIDPAQSQQLAGLIGVSALYSRAIGDGSYDGGRGQWLAGYRRSSLPEVLRHLKRNIGDPEFEDMVIRTSYDWQDTQITLGGLRLNDDLKLFNGPEQTFARYHDTYGWARATRNLTEAVDGEILVSRADLAADRDAAVNRPLIGGGTLMRARSIIVNTARVDMNAAVGDGTTLHWGARADQRSGNSLYQIDAHFLNPLARTFHAMTNNAAGLDVQELTSDPARSTRYSAYTAANLVRARWTIELGVRWDDYEHLDRGAYVSPRLEVRYALGENDDLRASAGRYVQAQSIDSLQQSSASTQSQTPEDAVESVLGYEHRFAQNVGLRIEAYAKHSAHTRPYLENALDLITLAPELEVDRVTVAPTSSTARGLEFTLGSTGIGPFSWKAGYAWSQARDTLSGQSVPRSWDQPDAFSASASWTHARWHYSAAFNWHTGWPYTPISISTIGGSDNAFLGPRNSQRFGNYASLDLMVRYRVPWGPGTLESYLEVHNALDRQNECCRSFNVQAEPDATRSIDVETESWLGIVPIVGVDWRF
jgi:outer membrane cobalamin receptor